MGGQGGEAYGSPFDIFEQFFGGQGQLQDQSMAASLALSWLGGSHHYMASPLLPSCIVSCIRSHEA